mgnify:FL=1
MSIILLNVFGFVFIIEYEIKTKSKVNNQKNTINKNFQETENKKKTFRRMPFKVRVKIIKCPIWELRI